MTGDIPPEGSAGSLLRWMTERLSGEALRDVRTPREMRGGATFVPARSAPPGPGPDIAGAAPCWYQLACSNGEPVS